MENKLIICPYCSNSVSEVDSNNYYCVCCEKNLRFTFETQTLLYRNFKPISEEIPKVFEIGEEVLFANREHPWYNKLGIICERKHKQYRIEINGKKLWVPNEWVKENQNGH